MKFELADNKDSYYFLKIGLSRGIIITTFYHYDYYYGLLFLAVFFRVEGFGFSSLVL